MEESQILSALKDKITSIASTDSGADTSVEQSVKKKNKIENRGEVVPLFSSDNTNSNQSEIEKNNNFIRRAVRDRQESSQSSRNSNYKAKGYRKEENRYRSQTRASKNKISRWTIREFIIAHVRRQGLKYCYYHP